MNMKMGMAFLLVLGVVGVGPGMATPTETPSDSPEAVCPEIVDFSRDDRVQLKDKLGCEINQEKKDLTAFVWETTGSSIRHNLGGFADVTRDIGNHLQNTDLPIVSELGNKLVSVAESIDQRLNSQIPH